MGNAAKVAAIVGQMNNIMDGFKLTIDRDTEVIHLDDSSIYKSRIQYSNKLIGPFGVIKDGHKDNDVQILLNVTEYASFDSDDKYVVQVLVQDRSDGAFLNAGVYSNLIESLYRLDV